MDEAPRVWVHKILALDSLPLRAHQLAMDLERLQASSVVFFLAEIQEDGARGDSRAGSFMMTLQEVLANDMVGYARMALLYKTAVSEGLISVQRLFLAPPARRKESRSESRKPPEGSDTLGMRTWQARSAGGAVLEKLLGDADPRVVRNLLLNPRLTERHVVKIVSRRPALAEVLSEVARSERWNRRASVRRALVFNPYTPTELSLRLLPLMSRGDLNALARDGLVHEEVSRQAQQFAQLRPPTKDQPSDRAVNEDTEQGRRPARPLDIESVLKGRAPIEVEWSDQDGPETDD